MSHLPGVWRLATVPPCWEQRPLGTVLWGGPVTVASHLTGAQLQELLPRRTSRTEITSDHRLRPRSGMVIHFSRLLPNEIVNVRGIPCTSVHRTILDLCAVHPLDVAEVALDAAIRMKRVTPDRLDDYVKEAALRSLRGVRRMRALLSVRGDDDALTESEAEHLLIRLLRKGALPIGQRQAPREGARRGRVDFMYPDHDLVIEVDGRKWHSGRRELKRDKRHDNELNISGKRVLRLTCEDLTLEKDYTLDVVARALGREKLI